MKHAWMGMLLIGSLAWGCGDDDGETDGGNGEGGTTTTTSTMGVGGGANGELCNDAPDDTACVTCTRAGCCDELQVCQTDTDCACLLDCFLAGTDPIECINQCGQSDATNDLVGCASTSCATECVQM